MKSILENVRVEITVRNPKNTQFDFPEFLTKHLDDTKQGKKIFMVPLKWEGFKNGFMRQLLKSGLDVYVALAYSTTGEERVLEVSKEGVVLETEIRPFIHKFSGGLIKKYVKKQFVVSFSKDAEFLVRLNLKASLPVDVERIG